MAEQKAGGWATPYKYTGKELDDQIGMYDYGARFYDPSISLWTSVDPLTEDMPDHGAYNYTFQNPIMYNDPTGMMGESVDGITSTIVTANDDGTYSVTRGNAYDGDNGIYLDDGNGGNGKLVGYSATPQSFYFSETESYVGAGDGQWLGTIDPTVQSGRNFLNNQVLKENPSVLPFMISALPGAQRDFKRTNGTTAVQFNTDEAFYRGMPLSLSEGDSSLPVFGSARDVGNISAGLVAGRNGMSWATARLGFDGLQSYQDGDFSRESTSTRYAEKLGHRIGSQIFNKFTKSRIPGSGHVGRGGISNQIIKHGGL